MKVDVVIPVYNEKFETVRETVLDIQKALSGGTVISQVILVEDGSAEGYDLHKLETIPDIQVIRHPVNRGYGSALKTGIAAGTAPLIAIIDADGTYPPDALPELIAQTEKGYDMVVGARIAGIREIPWLRRFPKWVLNRGASYMAGCRIDDLNSGMRVFTRELCLEFWPLYPKRFSFSSTITMGANLGDYQVAMHPINYYKRIGASSIHPIKDTIRFANIIVRMGILFHPLKLFIPAAGGLFVAGLLKAVLRDLPRTGAIGNLSSMLLLAALQILLLGYIGELIVINRKYTQERPER